MIIERAKPSDYQELKQLWLIVFDEEPTFLEHFFATRISYQDIFVARKDDKLVSALHALPPVLSQTGGGGTSNKLHRWGCDLQGVPKTGNHGKTPGSNQGSL